MTNLNYYKPSEEFLEKEEICGFNVTSERKAVWAVLLDLLLVFQSVCEKYNLKYWMFGGSMLGAARHNGFIPWDDDIDVIMPRRDYDKMMEIGPKEFSAPYVFENPITENGRCYYTLCKLRNERTAGMIEASNQVDCNRGLWMDIFALDDAVTCLVPWHYFIFGGVRLLSKIFPFDKVLLFKLWNWHERIFMNMHCDGYMQGLGPRAYRIYPDRFFWEGTVMRDFCGIKVPLPERYKEILSLCYGNWEKFHVKNEHFKIK